MVLGLFGTVIVTRHFSIEDFGVFTLILVFVSFLSQISTLGLELSISKFISGADNQTTQEQFFSTAVIVRLGAILLAILLAWLGRPLLTLLFGKSLLPGFFIFVPLLFALDSFRAFFASVLQGSFRFTKIGIADAIGSATYFVFLLVIVYKLNGNVTWLIFAKAISSLIACVAAFTFIPIKKSFSFHFDAFKELMKFGYPLQINSILHFTFSRIDTIVIAAFLGPTEVALYEVARKLPDYLRNLYGPFSSVYYPFISKRYAVDGQTRAKALMNEAVRFVAFVTLFGTAVAVVFGKEILQLLFSEKYLASVPVFILLMINLSIALVSNVMGTTLVAVGDTSKPMIINSFNAVASWVGSILLIPVYALIGAATANTVGTALVFPLNIYFLRKKIELHDAVYLKPFILFCVWSILVFIVGPTSFMMKVGFLVFFLLSSFFLSIVTKDDIILLVEGSGVLSWPSFQKLRVWWVSKR